MNWPLVAHQLACNAVYGAIAQERPPALPKAFVNKLLDLVRGHLEAMSEFITKDSGERVEFVTGSRRDVDDDKGRFDLLPPLCIRRVAQLYQRGSAKYGDNNWRLGQPMSRALSSMLRHAFQFAEGERSEDHLAAVVWNAFTLMYTEEMIKRGQLPAELNDIWHELDRQPDVSSHDWYAKYCLAERERAKLAAELELLQTNLANS